MVDPNLDIGTNASGFLKPGGCIRPE